MIIVRKKTRNLLLFILGLLLLILIALPTLIKNYAINNSKELLGRQIDIGKLKYNYFTSTVQVYDFTMFEQNASDHFTTFDTLIINLEPIRILFNEKVIERCYLKGLMVKSVMKDSVFNFDDLIAFHDTSEDTLINKEESEPFKYKISNIELKDANIFFDNQNVGKETHIEDFSFEIPFIGWDQEEKSNADINFNFANGGYFESSLNVNPVSGNFDAQVTVKELNLKPFYEYVIEYAEINDFNGVLNGEILIQGNTFEAVNSIISGHVDVNDFVMTDTNNKAFLKANRIDCNLKNIDYANSAYVIDSLNISNSYTFFQLDSITNNFYKIFKLNEPEASNSSNIKNDTQIDSTSSDLYYAINHLNVNNGILDYTDNITGQKFDYHLSEIKVNSDSIFSDSDWVNIYSDMLLNNRGTLNAKIGVNPIDTDNAEINITVEKFLLSDLNIYSNHYMGHDILEGDFYYNTKTKITNGAISSENKLLVKNVAVSSTEKGLYKLPLKFALFLLKDKNGDVNLDVPVRGDLNDPSVNVGKIVWTTFKNLIVKTVASPINFLAGLVDGDPKELDEIAFTYTDTIPVGKPLKQLDKLIELEGKKEGLKIEMHHFVDLNLQKEAIAFAEIGKLYNTETKKDYLQDEKDFETFIHAKIGSDSLSINESVMKLNAGKNLDSLVSINNLQLIKNTQLYLQEKNPFTKIEVLAANRKEPEQSGSKSRFKMKYDMLDKNNDIKTDTMQ